MEPSRNFRLHPVALVVATVEFHSIAAEFMTGFLADCASTASVAVAKVVSKTRANFLRVSIQVYPFKEVYANKVAESPDRLKFWLNPKTGVPVIAHLGGLPGRFAQEALGHNSKAVDRAYAKRASMKIPALVEWSCRAVKP